ncbi:SPOSA6832_03173 [Sporobolomyces salmonicolor]|uniref:SPOSA6832_03173-mRNA-1:cds n=1 Tax=Sporidiobolus salmonicolor TaxID=5005 RepID=A0A0D6EN27_SPOSA|nr:SPOSA6832_03173 [Sporobolomyces salmonicolor]
MSAFPLPIVDLDTFLASPNSPSAIAEATKTAEALIEYGALIVKDSRVSEEANERFLDLMEDYFSQDKERLEEDLRPEVHFQVGVTLENTEKPKCHSNDACKAVIAALDPAERPLDLEGGNADPKCRFFHRMGNPPPSTSFPSLAMSNVTPRAFASTWKTQMEDWGTQIKRAVEDVSEMLAVGLGLERDELRRAGQYGSHLLAPTATDLAKYGRVGESVSSLRRLSVLEGDRSDARIVLAVFAGFHTDLNFLTIHGRSRYAGLHVWARNSGKRISVKLPPGHLLVQAGKQLEHLTGGLILAGYHEVVCTPATLASLSARQSSTSPSASRPPIRISSTFFWHLSNDYVLRPREFLEKVGRGEVVGREREKQLRENGEVPWERKETAYEEGMMVGTLVQNELKEIALHA